MIIPESEEIVLSIIYCPLCKNHYRQNLTSTSCCVLHAPGTCCHYGDILMPADRVKELLALADKPFKTEEKNNEPNKNHT